PAGPFCWSERLTPDMAAPDAPPTIKPAASRSDRPGARWSSIKRSCWAVGSTALASHHGASLEDHGPDVVLYRAGPQTARRAEVYGAMITRPMAAPAESRYTERRHGMHDGARAERGGGSGRAVGVLHGGRERLGALLRR